jgi:hypothetical protein
VASESPHANRVYTIDGVEIDAPEPVRLTYNGPPFGQYLNPTITNEVLVDGEQRKYPWQ